MARGANGGGVIRGIPLPARSLPSVRTTPAGLWPSAASPPCPRREALRRVSRQNELDAIPSSGSDVPPLLSPKGRTVG